MRVFSVPFQIRPPYQAHMILSLDSRFSLQEVPQKLRRMEFGKYYPFLLLTVMSSMQCKKDNDVFEPWDSDVSKQWANKFVQYHSYIAQVQNLSNCWICSHAPIAAKTMPYFVTPLTEEELFRGGCWEMRALNLAEQQSQTSAALPITGWTRQPWFQINLTRRQEPVDKRPINLFEFKEYDGNWGNKATDKNYIGKVPDQELKLSFAVKTPFSLGDKQICSDQVCLERFLHDTNWTRNHSFLYGNTTQCTAREAVHVDEETREGQYGDGAAEMSISLNTEPECQPLRYYRAVTTDLDDSWCLYTDTIRLVSIAITFLNEFQFELPKGVYVVCRSNAYRWIPKGAEGACTLAKLEPATWVWNENDFPYKKVPGHMIAKRSAPSPQPPKHLMHTPWYLKTGMVLTGPLGVMFGTLRNAQMIEELGDIFDNVTEYLFDAINVESAYMRQLIVITNQHSMVLDYLTASQGGFCQVVGPACCHYIDPSGLMRVTHDIEQARLIKEGIRKVNALEDLPFPEWLAWLNPLNLFKGIGGWISGIIHFLIQAVFVILVIAVMIRLFVLLIRKILGSNCKCFPGKGSAKIEANSGINQTQVMTTYITTVQRKCIFCNKQTSVDLADCMHCGKPLV
ncbi:endogenous retrovirus group PABLB member 1 Env polyprotein-like isoform X1 [Dendrobates tinctorius]|uniref:endogenous retrovirus group PABLB member 1 Env polyprotein-like isoform X1 n=2 Tax=Dendrobates tinctorius TaxID=92724 RepID=UPI003CC97516